MLITKQYVVFGTNNNELDEQFEKITQEFYCAGWKIKRTERGVKFPCAIVTNKNVKIHIESCIPNHTSGIRWDNCWISNSISDKVIQDTIMPLSISDTPEIHFF